jgi:hypothetical protein
VMRRCVLCSGVANCPELGLVMIAALIIFSQFLRGLGLPKCFPVIGGWADLLAPLNLTSRMCFSASLQCTGWAMDGTVHVHVPHDCCRHHP